MAELKPGYGSRGTSMKETARGTVSRENPAGIMDCNTGIILLIVVGD